MTNELELKPPRRVLILDDSPLTLEAVSLSLSREGYDVRTLGSLDELDEACIAWAPDIVLTDVNMPGIAAAEICSALKSRVPSSAVILYSGLPDDDLERMTQEVGADGFVSKARGLKHLVARLNVLRSARP